MTITYTQVQAYLDAIAAKANLDASNARHGVFGTGHTTISSMAMCRISNARDSRPDYQSQ